MCTELFGNVEAVIESILFANVLNSIGVCVLHRNWCDTRFKDDFFSKSGGVQETSDPSCLWTVLPPKQRKIRAWIKDWIGMWLTQVFTIYCLFPSVHSWRLEFSCCNIIIDLLPLTLYLSHTLIGSQDWSSLLTNPDIYSALYLWFFDDASVSLSAGVCGQFPHGVPVLICECQVNGTNKIGAFVMAEIMLCELGVCVQRFVRVYTNLYIQKTFVCM